MKFTDMLMKPPVEAITVWNNPRFTAADKPEKASLDEPRICRMCNKLKPADDFRLYTNARGTYYRRANCKRCESMVQHDNKLKKRKTNVPNSL